MHEVPEGKSREARSEQANDLGLWKLKVLPMAKFPDVLPKGCSYSLALERAVHNDLFEELFSILLSLYPKVGKLHS